MPHFHLVPDTGVSSTDLLTNENSPTFEGYAADGSTVEVFADGTSIGSSGPITSGSWSVPATSPLADGEYVITYKVTDSDGTTTQPTESLTITIDTEDPGFTDGAAVTRTIEENIGSDQIIYTASATDSSGVTYRLKDGLADDAHRFTIFSNNGDVALDENPDHETQDVYNFTVVATDDAGNESEQAVTLNVTDQSIPKPSLISTQDPEQDGITNSSTPTFQGKAEPNSSVQVFIGNSGNSTALGTTTADSSGNWILTPSNYSGSPFPTDGDYSITYQFTKDGAVSDPSDPLTVTIDTVSPSFTEGATVTRTIEENIGSNQVVYEAQTTDLTEITYRLKTGLSDDAGEFTIDSSTGEVSLNHNPDHEFQNSYSFTVVATDAAGNPSTEQAVTLNVTNQDFAAPNLLKPEGGVDRDGVSNSSTPTFAGQTEADSTVEVFIDQDTRLGTTTADANGNWQLTSSSWELSPETTFASEGDYQISYRFTPVGGTSSDHSAPLSLKIDKTDPLITSADRATTIEEDSGAPQVVYDANSSDQSTVSYSLRTDLDDDADRFSIDSSNGQVSLNENPNHETQAQYQFTVVATDAAGNHDEKTVSLSIADKVGLAYASDGSLTNTQTPTFEGSAEPNTSVRLFKLDGGSESEIGTTNTYANGYWTFTVPSESLLSEGSNTIKVYSTPEGGGAETSSTLTITVDSTAPVINSGDPAPIPENSGTNQAVYTVTSQDASAVSYSIKQDLNDDADHFNIFNSGQVSLIETPDYEIQPHYQFTVVATDSAGNSSEKGVILNVNDLHIGHANLLAVDNSVIQGSDLTTNNNTPTIRISAPQFSEVEIFDGEKSLGTFTAQGSAEGAGLSTFTLPELDDGEHQIYHQYTPAGGREGTTSDQPDTPLTLTIDTSEPLITSPSIIAPIDENSGAGQVVYTATSSDPGATYSLSGADADYFAITDGVVSLKGNPDYASNPAYNFTVKAQDVAGNIASKELTLNVVDKTPPTMVDIPTLRIPENSGPYQPVYTVTSTDASSVSYSIKQDLNDDGDQFMFMSGISLPIPEPVTLTLIPSADYETKNYYLTTIVATDAAGNESEQAVTLIIDDQQLGHANLLAADYTVIQGSDLTTNNNTPTIRISAPQFSEVEIFDGQISLGTFTAQGSAEGAGWSTFTLPQLADGVHQIYHQYTPAGGVEGTTSDQSVAPLTLTIDTEPPPIIAPVNKSINLSPHEIAWDDGIAIEANPPLDLSGELTIAFWLNRDASPTIQDLQGIFQSYLLRIKTDGTLEWSRSGSGSASTDLFNVQGSTSIPVNKWTHISAVMRETGPGTYNAELWVNGVLDASSSSTEGIQNTQNNDLSIMTAGKFDNIQAWNTALAQSELSLVANNQGFDISRDSLIAEYTFENDTLGSIGNIQDSSGNGNHGSLVDENSGTIVQEPFSQGPRSSDQNVVEVPSAISIDENSGSGQVVYTAASSDLSATYSLSGTDASYFTIHDGVVTLTGNPIYASKPAYNFTVDAHDAAGNITSKELTLDVVDKTVPVIDSGNPVSIDENSGVNQVVYTPTSQDASAVSYSIKQDLNDDADHFTITTVDVLDGDGNIIGNIDQVSLIESPNFEDQEYYRFTVVATDAAGNFTEESLVLNVNDLHTGPANLLASDDSVIQGSDLTTNNNTPTIRISAPLNSEVEIFDGQISLGTFTAKGSAEGAGWSTFTLPQLADGVHQIYHQYTPAGGLEGTTSDRPVTPLTLTIDATPPSITSPSIIAPIDENSGAGQVVYTATSSDPGATYSLSGADADYFTITDGVVSLKGNPDFEIKNAYSFTLQANDANNNVSDQVVSLSINDVKPVKPSLLDVNNLVVDDGYTTSAVPKLSGLAEINSSVQLFIDGVEVNPSSTTINYDSMTGAWSVDLVNPVSMSGDNLIPSDGAYSVSVKATPVGGTHVEESDALVLTVDAVPDPVRAFWNNGEYLIDALGRADIGPSVNAITLKANDGRTLSDDFSRRWNGLAVVQSDDITVGGYRMLQIAERGRRKGYYRIAELNSSGVVQSLGKWVDTYQAIYSGYQHVFDIDLNGDGQKSIPSAVDDNNDGFVDGVDNYKLKKAAGSPVDFTDRGGRKFFTSTTRWKPIQAIETDSGFEILIQGTRGRNSSRYQVLTADSNGQLLTNTRWTHGDVLMRQGFEEKFGHNINGDLVIGTPSAVDQDNNGLVDGVTNYALFKEGAGGAADSYVDLTNSRGQVLSDASSRRWNVIQAVEDGSEFTILVQGERGRRRSQYQLWTADSTGQVTDTSRWLGGDQLSLDGYESIFAFDINNNGTMGT